MDPLPGSYQGTDVGQLHFCQQPAETKLAFHVTKGFLPAPSPRRSLGCGDALVLGGLNGLGGLIQP